MSTEYPFADFLTDSFAMLWREVPPIHAEMCRRLAGRTVRLEVDGEIVGVKYDQAATRMLRQPFVPTIDVQTSRAAILDLVDARRTLMESILDDRLLLRGAPDDLLAFHEGLMAYLHGAFRAPSFARLLHAFRSDARRRAALDRLRRTYGEESAPEEEPTAVKEAQADETNQR